MCLGFRIGFQAETGTHGTTKYYHHPEYDFLFYVFPSLLVLAFLAFFFLVSAFFSPPPPPSLRRYLLSFVLLHSFVQQCVLVENLCFPSININSSLSDLLASFVFCFISAFF